MRTRQRLSRKFLVRLVPILMSVFLFAGAFIAFKQYISLSAALDNKADRTALLLSVALQKPLWDMDVDQVDKVREAILKDPEVRAITITGQGNQGTPSPDAVFPGDGEVVRTLAIAEPGHAEIKIGEVVVRLSRNIMRVKIRNSLVALAATMFLALATVVLLSSLIQRRLVIRPLKSLLEGILANSQSQAFLPVRVHAQDEIGFLAESFNAKTKALKDHANHLQDLFLERERFLEELASLNAGLRDRDAQLLGYQEHLEEQVLQRSNQLLQTKQLLATTLDALPAYIAILDGAGTILATNQKWNQFGHPSNRLIFGVKPGADYRSVCGTFQGGSQPLGRIAVELLDIMNGTREPSRLEYAFGQEEQCRWFTVEMTRFLSADSLFLVLMHLDTTEQKHLELQLQQAQKLESIGQLAAGIAHEINTPTQFIGDNTIFLRESFQAILGLLPPFLDLLERADTEALAGGPASGLRAALETADLAFLQEEIPKAINQCLEGVGRVSRIVGAMKEFSHPGSATKMPLDLNRAIESTALVCMSEWKYVAQMVLELDPDLPNVPCLAGAINQVLLNLIINAAHAISDHLRGESGKLGLIRVRTRALGECVEVQVEDSGTGIAPEIRSRIFDPFFTTKPLGKGTGQGLAIAYAVIVKQHGGTISVKSETGRGATFIVRLPFAGSAQKPEPPAIQGP